MVISYCIYIGTFIAGIICVKKYRKLSAFDNRNKFKKRIYLSLAVIIPSIIAGIRYDVGVDWSTYKNIFEFTSMTGGSYLESGYVLLLRIVKYLLHGDYYFFNFVISAMLLGFTLLALIRIREITNFRIPLELGYYIALVLLWCVSFNATRQCLASAIVLYGLTWFYEKKWKFILWIIIASLFHQSAIFCILFIFLSFEFKRKSYQKIYNMFLYFGVIFLFFVIQNVLDVIGTLGLYTNYFDNSASDFSLNFMLYIIFPLVLIMVYAPKVIKNSKYYDLFFKLFVLQIPIQFAGNFVVYADRVSLYCNISSIVLFPLIASELSNSRVRKQFVILAYIWFTIYFVVMWGILGGNGIFPYQTKWG